jgi:hypothetical protein
MLNTLWSILKIENDREVVVEDGWIEWNGISSSIVEFGKGG